LVEAIMAVRGFLSERNASLDAILDNVGFE
jgi:hypothetical protein